jgi:hypothetical protein
MELEQISSAIVFKKIKREITFLYLFTNLESAKTIIKIKLVKPIGYEKFFSLTKAIHSSLINFQKNEYLSSFSTYGLFLLNQSPNDKDYTHSVELTYSELSTIVRKFKKQLLEFHGHNLNIYVKKPRAESMIKLIDHLASNDSNYVITSVRQLKSAYNRAIKKIDLQKTHLSENIYNTHQAINWYLENFLKACSPTCTITPINSPTGSEIISCQLDEIILETPTRSPLDFQLTTSISNILTQFPSI